MLAEADMKEVVKEEEDNGGFPLAKRSRTGRLIEELIDADHNAPTKGNDEQEVVEKDGMGG